jgi:hypothetical protein
MNMINRMNMIETRSTIGKKIMTKILNVVESLKTIGKKNENIEKLRVIEKMNMVIDTTNI